MAFAEGFPGPTVSGRQTLRFFVPATVTTGNTYDTSGQSFVFATAMGVENIQGMFGASVVQASTIIVQNTGGSNSLLISFDGVTDHGEIPPNTTRVYWNRFETGISIKPKVGGSHSTYIIEAY